MFVGIAILLWLFDASLASEEGFNSLGGLATSFLGKLILWGVLAALAYHMMAGCKHLLMDFGIGETKEAAPIGAKVVIVVSIVLFVVLGVWIW